MSGRVKLVAGTSSSATAEDKLRNKASMELVKPSMSETIIRLAKGEITYSDQSWVEKLDMNIKGEPFPSSKNILTVLDNHPALRNRIVKDVFEDRIYGITPLPWGNRQNTPPGLVSWSESDDNGLAIFMENQLGCENPRRVKAALSVHLSKMEFNPLTEWLSDLKWDGTKRLDTLYIDYLGAENNKYNRVVCRKAIIAAVARAMKPGCKFDYMTILSGKQGLGKSTFLRKLAGDRRFTDSLSDFRSKEGFELLQSAWFVEIGEFERFGNVEAGDIKQFVSAVSDKYRPPYGTRAEHHPRHCVFFGTTNVNEFLRDTTGGRRFWPVWCGVKSPTKSVFDDLPNERNQIFAEAMYYYNQGESLELPVDICNIAAMEQETARESDPLEGMIFEFIEKPIPTDWNNKTESQKRSYFNGGNVILSTSTTTEEMTKRNFICAAEICNELLRKDKTEWKYFSRRINAILATSTDWERLNTPRIVAGYGSQRGFRRK